MPVGAPLDKLTVAGVNVPPPAASLGVTITVPAIVPPAGVTPTVKFVDAVDATPDVGPAVVMPLAAAGVGVAPTAWQII